MEYNKLFDKLIDIDELKAQKASLDEELKSSKAAVTAANREIERLQKELDKAILDSSSSAELDKLRERLDNAQNTISDLKSKDILQRQELQSALENRDRAERSLAELKQSAATQTEESNKIIAEFQDKYEAANFQAEQLNASNASLRDSILLAIEERDHFKRQVEDLSKQTYDIGTVSEIEYKILEIEAQKKEAEKNRDSIAKRLEEIESKYHFTQSKLDELEHQYLMLQKNETLARKFLNENSPQCKLCGRRLTFSKSKFGPGYYWRCPGYPNCKAKTFQFQHDDYTLLDEYNDILFNNLDITSDYLKLSEKDLQKFKRIERSFSAYPISYEGRNLNEFLFQSISVPTEVFNNRYENHVDLFSKFSVITSMTPCSIEEKHHTIYSLALKLLNRGVVLPQYNITEDALREYFNVNSFGSVNSLINYIEYSSPINAYDSQREKLFAEYYFPKILGKNWATFVSTQVSFDILSGAEDNDFVDQRIDFMVNKNGRHVVIELDGPEHVNKVETDSARDTYLKQLGCSVLRFSNDDVDSKSDSIFESIHNALGDDNHLFLDTDIDDRFLVASKICHQFCVAIIKSLEKGLISRHCNLNATASTDMFSNSELNFILSIAISEVYSILENYADIYNIDRDWNFLDAKAKTMTINIGDGCAPEGDSITIRDNVLPIDYLCDIDIFSNDVFPVNPDLDALKFFLAYIFGFNEGFREGQYEAIKSLLNRKDTIVLLPTGSGKSIIYQLSSFIVPGIVVVISPLISLIEDQIENLELNHGITTAIHFSSSTSADDKRRKATSKRIMQHNSTCLLYIAPERLQIPSFRFDIERMMRKNRVFAVAVDEAHCVSEWGHDFRPAYLNVGTASRRLFKKNTFIPVITALTGTASEAVLNDVRLDLNIDKKDTVLPRTFDREELHFSLKTCSATAKDYAISNLIRNEIPQRLGISFEDMVRLEGDNKQSGLIFTPLAKKKNSQYSAITIASNLMNSIPEFGVGEYFSSRPDEIEEETWRQLIRDNAKRFKNNRLDLLVATKAFGMGIDKKNIHYIIHDGIPMSFEQYYQEAGRAGRDKKHSECVLLYSNDNVTLNADILTKDLPFDQFKEKYQEYCEITKDANADDISSLLYFHNQTFIGIDDEVNQLNKVLDKINPDAYHYGDKISIVMPLTRTDEDGTEKKLSKETEEKKWVQALVRLVILGIIEDYTYDYNCNFTLTFGSIEKENISNKYAKYISGNVKNKKYIAAEKGKLIEFKESGLSFAKFAAKTLIEYIYGQIEMSRRAAIYNMYDAANEASKYKGEEQDQHFRKYILSYFALSGDIRNQLQNIEDSNEAGFAELLELFDLSIEKDGYDSDDISSAQEIYILSGRLLESKPDHPGLLLARAIGQLISGNYEPTAVENTIKSALSYASRKYKVDKNIVIPTFASLCNLVLKKSFVMFDNIVECYSQEFNELNSMVIAEMISSDRISDDNKEYLLLTYAQLITKNIRRK